jgi:hypothetical protein
MSIVANGIIKLVPDITDPETVRTVKAVYNNIKGLNRYCLLKINFPNLLNIEMIHFSNVNYEDLPLEIKHNLFSTITEYHAELLVNGNVSYYAKKLNINYKLEWNIEYEKELRKYKITKLLNG